MVVGVFFFEVNAMREPISIDDPRPSFSWRLDAIDGRRGVVGTAAAPPPRRRAAHTSNEALLEHSLLLLGGRWSRAMKSR